MGGRILLFKTKNIPDGVEVKLQKVDPKIFLPKTEYVATLDGQDVIVKRESSWSEEFYVGDENVSERKREFEWMKVDPSTGQRTKASLQATTSINAVKEISFSLISKSIVPKGGTNLYLMVPWKGRKGDRSADKYPHRCNLLFEEAMRMAKEEVAGIGSFTWGI